MQKSYECELATHIGPESSRVRSFLRDADAVGERPHPVHRYREVHWSPARSETPCTYADTLRGNREICDMERVIVSRQLRHRRISETSRARVISKFEVGAFREEYLVQCAQGRDWFRRRPKDQYL